MRYRLAIAALLSVAAFAQKREDDPILRAMGEEIVRSNLLTLVEKPYYIQYQIEDVENFSAAATLGGLLNASRIRFRVPLIDVRVGDYSFDNSNHVYSNYYTGARYDPPQWPLDDLSCPSPVSMARDRSRVQDRSRGLLPQTRLFA